MAEVTGKREKLNPGLNLPEEMLMEILAKLPVKSLVKLSCVCKTWRALTIKNPYFGEKHLNNKKDIDPTLIFVTGWPEQSKNIHEEILQTNNPLHIVSRNQKHGAILIGSCNGIICFKGIGNVFWLYNPITMEYLDIPSPLSRFNRTYQSLGFGFDSTNNDYKIIKISKCVEVYSLLTNMWSKLELNLDYEDYSFIPSGVFLSGFFHWSIYGKKESSPCFGEKTILTFDFKDEKFGNIKYPNQEYNDGHIRVLDDSLAFLSHLSVAFKYDVWVMKEYGKTESWTKRFSVVLPAKTVMSNVVTFWVHNTDLVILLKSFSQGDQPVNDQVDKGGVFFTTDYKYSASIIFRPTLVSLRKH